MFAEYENGTITLYYTYMYREAIKEIQGRYWDTERKVWTVPFKAEILYDKYRQKTVLFCWKRF